MKDKLLLDREVCTQTGFSQSDVADITSEFLFALMMRVSKTGEVHLPGFGAFRVVVRKGTRTTVLMEGDTPVKRAHKQQSVVSFKKSARFKKKLREHEELRMEKYAVDEEVDQDDLEKKASEGCPKCGKAPEKHGRTLVCPKHGTEPFEKG